MNKFFILLLFFIQFSCPWISNSAVNMNEAGGYNHIILDGAVAAGNTGDDIWIGDSTYPFQSSAVLTYASSSSANDAAAGTGCRTLLVKGLDSSYNYQSESVTMNGTSAVALTGTYIAVNQVDCVTVGSGGVNAGTILVGAYNTSLQNMPANKGKAQAAVYVAPADKPFTQLVGWGFSVGASTTAQGAVELQMQEYGKSWKTVDVMTGNDSAGNIKSNYNQALYIPPKASLRLRILSTGTLLLTGHRFNGTLELIQKQ